MTIRVLFVLSVTPACLIVPPGDALEDHDADGVVGIEDCDDHNDAVSPNLTEVCDGIDNDCNGMVDDDDPNLDTSTRMTFYADLDEDGFGDVNGAVAWCSAPSGFVDNPDDCDDSNGNIYPGATEIALDGIDQDCDFTDDNYDGFYEGTLTASLQETTNPLLTEDCIADIWIVIDQVQEDPLTGYGTCMLTIQESETTDVELVGWMDKAPVLHGDMTTFINDIPYLLQWEGAIVGEGTVYGYFNDTINHLGTKFHVEGSFEATRDPDG